MSNDVVQEVLASFGAEFDRARILTLGSAGGFSGAEFWRAVTDRGKFCVRKWPKQCRTGQLQFIHNVLRHVAATGFTLVPVPQGTVNGISCVELVGHLWELTPWMPGQADYGRHPNRRRLAAASTALAEFHQAALGRPKHGVSPGISSRSVFLNELLSGTASQIADRVANNSLRWPELDERASRLMRLFESAAVSTSRALQACIKLRVALQPCIRDIRHDHVLFQGDAVSGIVDFGAMRDDNVATDIARLLGSLVGNDRSGWHAGLEAYQQVRALTPEEHQLVASFDASSVTLSGMNWLKWIYVDGRQFDDRRAIEGRLDEIMMRF